MVISGQTFAYYKADKLDLCDVYTFLIYLKKIVLCISGLKCTPN